LTVVIVNVVVAARDWCSSIKH